MVLTDPRIMVAMVAMAALVFAAGCGRSAEVEASFTVGGMHCEGCSSAITDALLKIEGVTSASANHEDGSARATYRSPAVSPEQLATAIEDLGYTVTDVTTAPAEG